MHDDDDDLDDAAVEDAIGQLVAKLGGKAVRIDERSKRSSVVRPKDVQARVILDMLSVVHRPNPFKVGDLVEQVPEFSRYVTPDRDGLALVTAVLPEQSIRESKGDGSPCSRDDIVVLVRAGRNSEEWVEYPVESWRFRLYLGDVA